MLQTMKKEKSFLLGAILLLFGILLIVSSLLSMYIPNDLEGKCVATVTKVSTSEQMIESKSVPQTVYKTYISYVVDGVSYEDVEAVTSTSAVNVGDTIQVAYNTDNPYEVTPATDIMTIAIRVGGYVMLFLGLLISMDYFLEKNVESC